MKIYSVTYKEKCIYTDSPMGEPLQADIAAKNVDHLLYLCHTQGWHVLSYQRIA